MYNQNGGCLVRIFYIFKEKGNNDIYIYIYIYIYIFLLSPFCLPITHININICRNFQSIPLSRKKCYLNKCWKSATKKKSDEKSVTEKCDGRTDVQTDAGQKNESLSVCLARSRPHKKYVAGIYLRNSQLFMRIKLISRYSLMVFTN